MKRLWSRNVRGRPGPILEELEGALTQAGTEDYIIRGQSGDLIVQGKEDLDGGVLPLQAEPERLLGPLKGLYQNDVPPFNPSWEIPTIQGVHLQEDIIREIPDRRWAYIYPIRFWPNEVKYRPREQGITDKYPEHTRAHSEKVSLYLQTLYNNGILYKRESRHVLLFNDNPYSWESNNLLPCHCHKSQDYEGLGRQPPSRRSNEVLRPSVELDRGKPLTTRLSPRAQRPDGRPSRFPAILSNPAGHQPSGIVKFKQTLPAGQSPRISTDTRQCHVRGNSRTLLQIPPSICQPQHNMDSSPRGGILGGTRPLSREGGSGRTYHTGSRAQKSSSSKATSSTPKQDKAQEAIRRHTCAARNSYQQLNRSRPASISNLPPRVTTYPEAGRKEYNCKHERRCFSRSVVPSGCTGRVFLVNKSSGNSSQARLVVDFSQFSRGKRRVHFPRYFSPNTEALSRILPPHMWRISLDLAEAFYHLPYHTSSSLRLSVSDGKRVYLFRRAAMGVGLSPWNLTLFTSIIAERIRKYFSIHCFAYMDDFILSHPNPRYLIAAANGVVGYLQQYGVRINFDKSTLTPTRQIVFMGLQITPTHIHVTKEKFQKLHDLLTSINTDVFYDWKILQRFAGHFNQIVAFSLFGSHILGPIYLAITNKADFCFTKSYVTDLRYVLNHVYDLRLRASPKHIVPSVAADATLTHGGIATRQGEEIQLTFSEQRPVHVQELLIALVALLCFVPKGLLSDSTFVVHKQLHTLPYALAAVGHYLLSRAKVTYVHTSLNPADPVSRLLANHSAPRWPLLVHTSLVKPLYIPWSLLRSP
ncbi:polymerase [Tibetan frog hepatitis B virus]|uniref:Protein P n=1 Tax=Tibetan frog hepatitis B virus TaxID=2169919 RepID=A0A193AU50_9HEPA|nr:polymerase [Tibetan frog hepatitis B virus]ANN02857.1 polymerase [Tibetan frog hepatitis B virus]